MFIAQKIPRQCPLVLHKGREISLYLTENLIVVIKTTNLLLLFVELRPIAFHGLLILEVSRSHTTTHHRRYDSSGRVTSSSQRPLPDSTQHSQQTNIHDPGGIRTHSFSRREAADRTARGTYTATKQSQLLGNIIASTHRIICNQQNLSMKCKDSL